MPAASVILPWIAGSVDHSEYGALTQLWKTSTPSNAFCSVPTSSTEPSTNSTLSGLAKTFLALAGFRTSALTGLPEEVSSLTMALPSDPVEPSTSCNANARM